MDPTANACFATYQKSLEKESELREEIKQKVRQLELVTRNLQSVLLMIHAPQQSAPEIVKQARTHIPALVTHYAELQSLVPEGKYYKYSGSWSHVSQQAAFLLALMSYLEDANQLLTHEQFLSVLQVDHSKFPLELEVLLLGVLNVASELSRLAVNAVISGDHARPRQISVFLNNMQVAFRMLNLKNDQLRKRFDALKYDIKKVEEVIFDLTIRGLLASKEDDADHATKPTSAG